MKRITLIPAALILLVAALVANGAQPQAVQADAVDTGALIESFADNQVWICHFPGHDGDFVTFNSGSNPIVCNQENGNAIRVGRPACKNGHRAFARFGKDCDTTDQP